MKVYKKPTLKLVKMTEDVISTSLCRKDYQCGRDKQDFCSRCDWTINN